MYTPSCPPHIIFIYSTGYFQLTHSFLWTPYFSWRISHHRHHSNHASMERDEVYVPKTREDLGIPNKPIDQINWDEVFGDTPIYTLYMLIRQQVLAFPAYLCKVPFFTTEL